MEFEKVKIMMLKKLQDELPQHLSYHSVNHVNDVMEAVERIAELENVQGDDLVLLKTAAVFHDSGFLYGAQDHEKKSCEIAKTHLPDYGYNETQIERICGMIMATKIPQSPKNHLEEILADADLDYLGRADFFTIGNRLYAELAMFGIVNTTDDWNNLQIRFLENHNYFTHAAIASRKEQKDKHLAYLKSEIAKNEAT